MLEREDLASLKKLAFATDEFEPFADQVISALTLGRLIDLGLAECGPSFRPAVGDVGYRLTASGWEIVRRHWGQTAPSLVYTDEAALLDA